ncbi:MAG TPA: inositol monophosphatase [Bacteroidales bacterium]|nr:inositol monophosphatase [Bacteroidales bacterium]
MKDTLITALRTSGAELLNIFGSQIESTQKESQSSIVTKADLKSDALIVKLITDKFPDHNILSEEGGFKNRGSEYTWVIDPLDGTSNFASAIPWFGVLIALFKGNTPILGGAYLPVNDQLFFAETGKGAYRNGKQFYLDKSKILKNALVAFAVDYTDDAFELENSLSIYRNLVQNARNIRATNCLVDFLNVAEGKFGACINLYTRIWDIASLGLIISEAGGVMKDICGNNVNYLFNEGTMEQNFPVMAGSESIITELRKYVLI